MTRASAQPASALRAIVVEDEPLERAYLSQLLEQHAGLAVVGESGDGRQAIGQCERLRPDALFLDVGLPGCSGLDLLDALPRIPAVVFVTASTEYAPRAFQLDAVDYLLKPFDAERVATCVARLMRRAGTGSSQGPRLIGRRGRQRVALRASELDWIEAASNYVRLHRGDEVFLMRGPLSALEQRLEPHRFRRIHRTALVNLERVAEFWPTGSGDFLLRLVDGSELRLSRRYRARLESHWSSP